MYPLDFFAVQYFRSIGTRLTKNLLMLGGTILGVLLCVLTFARIEAPTWNLVWVILMIPITFSLNYLFGVLFGSVAFWVKREYDYDGVKNSYENMMWILIGSSIPLDKIPFGVGNYLAFLPTSWLLHHPMQIYLENIALTRRCWSLLVELFGAFSSFFFPLLSSDLA